MNPYAKLTQIMEERGATLNGYNLEVATVTGVSPVQIKIGDVNIGVGIYLNPALSLGINISGISTEENGLKAALNSFYNAFKLNVGDSVLVQRVGNSFYIISKVVKA